MLHRPQAHRENNSERLLNHAVYALSMQRDLAHLQRIAADPDMADQARAAARWWLGLPRHMLTSAEQ